MDYYNNSINLFVWLKIRGNFIKRINLVTQGWIILILLNGNLLITKKILSKLIDTMKKNKWKYLDKFKSKKNILLEFIFGYIYKLINFNKYIIACISNNLLTYVP